VSRREGWGAALLTAAALVGWGGTAVSEAARVAASSHLVVFVAVPAECISAWLLAMALIAAVAGASLLAPALIRRIRRRKLRLATAWTAGLAAAAAVPYLALLLFFVFLTAAMSADYVRLEAADGQSVLITQDQFDGEAVDIYVRQDDTHYRWSRSAPELAGWPRVKDQNCRLDTVGGGLQLACKSGTLAIGQNH
jgi:MFS family permease